MPAALCCRVKNNIKNFGAVVAWHLASPWLHGLMICAQFRISQFLNSLGTWDKNKHNPICEHQNIRRTIQVADPIISPWPQFQFYQLEKSHAQSLSTQYIKHQKICPIKLQLTVVVFRLNCLNIFLCICCHGPSSSLSQRTKMDEWTNSAYFGGCD